MKQVTIENPIINSPFEEPRRHFRFDQDGITDEIVESRRISHYFIPIAQPKKKGKQLNLDLGVWTQDRVEENEFINQVRGKVSLWRRGGYMGVTSTTRKLLEYWSNPERDRRLFFCQIEALETVIYITEVAKKYGDNWIENQLRQFNADANPLLFRMACKMATGSGKTVLMSMIIAWHVLNKGANKQDARFGDTFLVVTPGITIRDRLRVLQPNDPENYYRKLDLVHLVPSDMMPELERAKILITNYHAFKPREHTAAGKLTKDILTQSGESAFTETPAQMVSRVCRTLGIKKNIIVLNDEAHHCYRRRVGGSEDSLKGDDRKESQKREEEARIWISGLEAIQQKIGVKTVYDLSATPFFLKGSGYPEGNLFPWVMSDFSLIDAIESGIVKVPRVPISDDNVKGELPTYRNIWALIRDELPKKSRAEKDESKTPGGPNLPKELEGAILSLYNNYEARYQQWEQDVNAIAKGQTPPVFIVVCNNTNVSKLVYDYISGWDTGKVLPNGEAILASGKLSRFSNVVDGRWTARPSSILVDSEQLESGEAMSADFKKIAKREIDEFKAEYRDRFPGQDPDKISDEDLLREVMNTVGKTGKLGERIKCVVSVSMLTEGWDANTVTHILGVRAFGTQLLCEQVVGRGLRRISYAVNEQGMFEPEYAEVYGVPFAFIPCAGSGKTPKPTAIPTRVRALDDRINCEITFPRLLGYRYDIRDAKLTYDFTGAKHSISTADLPTITEIAPIVGQSVIHDLSELRSRREQEVAFLLAKLVLEKYFRWDGETKPEKSQDHLFDPDVKAWLFPQLLQITKLWLQECVTCKSGTFIQELLLIELAHDAADKIYTAIASSTSSQKTLKPILRPYDTFGSTRYVDFDTTRPTYVTDAQKCHISHVVADTNSWEQKMAQVLEDMDEVTAYAKNQNLGFKVPYAIAGTQRNYLPDFIVRVDDGHSDDLLNLILEVSGEARKDKAAKTSTTRSLWIPAVNNHGSLGRWAFIEITDPWDAEHTIRAFLKQQTKH